MYLFLNEIELQLLGMSCDNRIFSPINKSVTVKSHKQTNVSFGGCSPKINCSSSIVRF